MDMAPRWSGGYGFQIRYESYGSDLTVNAKDINASFFHKTYFLEGVYTWDRSARITLKLPYQIIEKSDFDILSKNNSFGDLIIAVPLKKYNNYKSYTQNIGVTPQVKIPLDEKMTNVTGPFSGGVSLSYSSESFSFYQLYDIFSWFYNYKDPLLGLDINLGFHPYHDNATNKGLFVIWDATCRWENSYTIIQTGPAFMLYNQNIMMRAELKLPVIETGGKNKLSKGVYMNIGLGFVF